MRHTRINKDRGTHHAVAAAYWVIAAFWIVAGIAAVIALGGGLTRLALAVAVAITEWWLISGVEDRFERNLARSDAEMASVTHIRPALTDQRDLKKISPHASWRGPSAA